MNEHITIDTATAARLTEQGERWMRKLISSGRLPAEAVTGEQRGGNAGTVYRIPLSALPAEAQIRYWEQHGREVVTARAREELFDLGAYKARHGEDGVRELLNRQQAVLQVIGLRDHGGKGLTEAIERAAEAHGMSSATLRRLEARYNERGLAGLTRSGRSDKGESRTMCLKARQMIGELYLDKNKLKAQKVYDNIAAMAWREGPNYCLRCPFNHESPAWLDACDMDEEERYPACDKAGGGIIAPNNRHAVNRAVSAIPPEVAALRQDGEKKWRDMFMKKIWRVKPDTVNLCWFGDHHKFDLFVLDKHSKPARPWLTIWYDIGSGRPTGWCISTNPNSTTITYALLRGIAAKPGSDIWGKPKWLYMDNGMDYRSKRFKGTDENTQYWRSRDPELAEQMYTKLTNASVVEALDIKVHYAQPYYGEAKPVERFFGTIEDRYIRELPGYCGNSPENRPEGFERDLKRMAESGALLSLDEFVDVFANQILPDYENHPHGGYNGEKPAERYARLPRYSNEKLSPALLDELAEMHTERKVFPQGIRFDGRWYWNDELLHLVGQRVIIRYADCWVNSLSVRAMDETYICEAALSEGFDYVEEDPERIAAHITVQQRQKREAYQLAESFGAKPRPGKRARGDIYYPAIDESEPGNITSLPAEQAARQRASRKAQREEVNDWTEMDEAMLRRGRAMNNR